MMCGIKPCCKENTNPSVIPWIASLIITMVSIELFVVAVLIATTQQKLLYFLGAPANLASLGLGAAGIGIGYHFAVVGYYRATFSARDIILAFLLVVPVAVLMTVFLFIGLPS